MIAVDDDGSTNPEATSHNSNERNSVDLRVVIIVLSIFAFYQSGKQERNVAMSMCGEFDWCRTWRGVCGLFLDTYQLTQTGE